MTKTRQGNARLLYHLKLSNMPYNIIRRAILLFSLLHFIIYGQAMIVRSAGLNAPKTSSLMMMPVKYSSPTWQYSRKNHYCDHHHKYSNNINFCHHPSFSRQRCHFKFSHEARSLAEQPRGGSTENDNDSINLSESQGKIDNEDDSSAGDDQNDDSKKVGINIT